MPPLEIKKIYVDSRHKTADSVSDSNFKFELPFNVNTPEDTVFYVTEISMPNVFQTIQEGYNDRMYWAIGTRTAAQLDPPMWFYSYDYHITKFPAGNYTIAEFAQVFLNAIGSQYISVSYDDQNFCLVINNTSGDKSVRIFSDISAIKQNAQFSNHDSEDYRKTWNLHNTTIPFYQNAMNSVNEILSLINRWIC
jgi:hypothetical protein